MKYKVKIVKLGQTKKSEKYPLKFYFYVEKYVFLDSRKFLQSKTDFTGQPGYTRMYKQYPM